MAETQEQQTVQQPTYSEMTFTANQVKAIDFLVKGIQIAQRRGAFNLQESSSLNEAFKEIIPGYGQVTETKEEEAAA